MNRVEERIRRNLAANLSLLGDGLRLVQEEYKLPNPYGSKGFIDILAVDDNDRYVIIEVKRSNQAARQALHEMFKYPILLQHELGVKPSEIRIIIVSTEWAELRVPFVDFADTSKYDVMGIQLEIDNEANPVRIELVSPVDRPTFRELSRNHLSLLYSRQTDVMKNVEKIKGILEDYGLRDFVLLLLSTQKDIPYRFAIYIAHQRCSEDTYIRLLQQRFSKSHERHEVEKYFDEIEAFKMVSTTEEYITHLEEALLSSLGYEVDYDDLEIGGPEKLAYSLSNGWQIVEIYRYGRYAKDRRLKDESILIEELLGLSGINFEYYMTQCHSTSRAKMREIKGELERFLEYPPIWREHIMSAIEKHKRTPFRLNLFVYNPGNVLEYLWATYKYQTPSSLPHYQLIIDVEELSTTYIYIGFIKWNGTKPRFSDVMRKVYRHDFFQYFLNRLDVQKYDKTMRELGFSFETKVVVLGKKSQTEYSYTFVGHTFDLVPFVPVQDAYLFVLQSTAFMNELDDYFTSHIISI